MARWISKGKLGAGYVGIATRRNGTHIFEHQVMAERALGRRLQRGEVVHHVNEDRADNRPENLVICRIGYHALIHARMRARQATGDANARLCMLCHEYEVGDAPMQVHTKRLVATWRHAVCHMRREQWARAAGRRSGKGPNTA